MAWIILEVDADGEKIGEVHDIRVMNNEDCEIAMFETSEEADRWLESNNKIGLTYHTIEIW